MDWFTAAQIFVLSQGILLCIIILSVRGGNRTANNILALYIGITTLGMVRHLMASTDTSLHGVVYGVFILVLLQGPVLYFYVKALTDKSFSFQRQSLLHLLCLLPGILIFFQQFFQLYPVLPITGNLFASRHVVPGLFLINDIIIFAYGVLALRLLELHRNRLENTFSAIGTVISLNWLKWLILFLLAVRLSYIARDLMVFLGHYPVFGGKASIFLLLNAGVIYFIAIGGLRQPLIFTSSVRKALESVEFSEQQAGSKAQTRTSAANTQIKYQKSTLNEKKINKYWSRLETLFEQQQTYMQEDLNLSHLAELLGISSHELSQVINMKSGSNFYELVNRYRINKARELLENPENSQQKLLAIGMEVGYKSQSTFYSQFNRQVGMTPKRYRDKCLGEAQTGQTIN